MPDIGLVTGIVGGLIATIAMTVVMMALSDSPPPTASLWSKYVGDGPPDDFMMQGMALHFLYGITAGAVFSLAIAIAAPTAGILTVIGGAIVYGILLMIVGAVFWIKIVLGMDPDQKTAMTFGVSHLVYGITLGLVAWYVPLG